MADEDDYGSLKFRNVSRIKLGRYEFDTWFGNSALFVSSDNGATHQLAFKSRNMNALRPGRTVQKPFLTDESTWLELLHVCPYCFKHTDVADEMEGHLIYCNFKKELPGKVQYLDTGEQFVIRKVRGLKYSLFSQNLCLLAKFFLDNKSVLYYLNQYDFYVAYSVLDGIETPVGFYSRELTSWESNNLSCICVFPCYQQRRIGTKLIEFSYKLSEYERQVSGPERPLSKFGKLSYLQYWCRRICWEFTYGKFNTGKHISLEVISRSTFFRATDILLALDFMEVLYEAGERNPYMDFYLSEYKTRDYYVLLSDPKDSYSLILDRHKMRKWLVNNNMTHTGAGLLNDSFFVFY